MPPLALPQDADLILGIHHLEATEVVRLFTERAKAVVPSFTLTEQNARPIVQICNQLDGIPLAIELTAARVKMLSVEQIAARLADRFRLLTGGSRTILERQQTLKASIDWSYQLLSEKERSLFTRLAVFVGGWTLEAAERLFDSGETQIVHDRHLTYYVSKVMGAGTSLRTDRQDEFLKMAEFPQR